MTVICNLKHGIDGIKPVGVVYILRVQVQDIPVVREERNIK